MEDFLQIWKLLFLLKNLAHIFLIFNGLLVVWMTKPGDKKPGDKLEDGGNNINRKKDSVFTWKNNLTSFLGQLSLVNDALMEFN